MSIYYKFKSSNFVCSIPLVGQYLSVGNLKEKIWEAKRLCNGNDFGISLYNVQTGEEYVDDSACIPRSTSVSVRRIPRKNPRLPGLPQESIVVAETQRPRTSIIRQCNDLTVTRAADDQESESGSDDGFGEEIYALPKTRSSGRMSPPIGYVCRRCGVPGHFIQHCPTNGNPNYYENKPLTRPPIAAAAFEKEEEEEIKGIPGSVRDNIPPELKCPVCKEVMKDAVFTTRCCFRSYCSECIRVHRGGTESACVCGSTSMLIDDLVPNTTLRETISRILASAATGSTSSGNSAPALAVDVKTRAGDTGKQGKATEEKKRKQSYVDADVCQRALNYVRMPRPMSSSSSGYGYKIPYFRPGCVRTGRGSNVWTADFRKKQMKMSIC